MKIDLGGGGEAYREEAPLTDWNWTATFPPEKPLTEVAVDLKRSLIQQALEQCNGSRTEAARLLKITRDTLKRQMKTLKFFSSA